MVAAKVKSVGGEKV